MAAAITTGRFMNSLIDADGTRYRITVANGGALTTTAL